MKRLTLIATLRDRLPLEGDREVTHALETPLLPDPPLIGNEQPDLLARGLGGKLIIGLAKTGPDFSDEQSRRQYQAFAGYRDPESDENAALNLVVPAKFKGEADAALERAGLSQEQFFVLGVHFPGE